MSTYRESLEAFLKGLDIKANRVLDIGGAANPVKNRVRTWLVNEYRIMDNYAENATAPVDYEYDLNIEIPFSEKKGIEKFDLVFCLEVFEYIFDPITALGTIYSLTKDNGHAYITFPTLYPLHNPEGFDFLRYQKDGIDYLLEEFNFTVEQIIPRFPSGEGIINLGKFYASEGLHARKHTNDIYSMGYIYKVRK